MVADEVEERLVADEFTSAKDGMTIAASGGLGDEADARTQGAAGLGVSGFVAGADDDAELLDPGAGGFLEHDLKGGFRFSVLIHQRLERQGALAGIGGGDEGFRIGLGGGMGIGKIDAGHRPFNWRGAAGSGPAIDGAGFCAI